MVEALGLGMAYQVLVSADRTQRRFTYLSESCLSLTGVRPEAAIADHRMLDDLILPRYRQAMFRAEAEAVAGGAGRFQIDVEMLGPDGEMRWRRVAAARHPRPDGSHLWHGLISDVTEARRSAEALEDQRRRLEIAVDATGLGFWELDLRTDVLTWSERNKEIFGLPPEAQVTLKTFMTAVHPDDVQRCREVIRNARSWSDGKNFLLEYRAVTPDGRLRWIVNRGRVVYDETGPVLAVGTTLDNTDRHMAEEQRSLMMGELAHRAKNGLQVMMGIIRATARSTDSVPELERVLLSRLQAMTVSQDLVTAARGRPVRLGDLASLALEPFGAGRFDIEPAVSALTVEGDVATGLALLLHEFATNAVKYGALSSPEGRVTLQAEPAKPGMAALRWRERGGPEVRAAARQGFGSRLLKMALRNQGGKVEAAFDPSGFSARMDFPVGGQR